jgi:hypothetical protein
LTLPHTVTFPPQTTFPLTLPHTFTFPPQTFPLTLPHTVTFPPQTTIPLTLPHTSPLTFPPTFTHPLTIPMTTIPHTFPPITFTFPGTFAANPGGGAGQVGAFTIPPICNVTNIPPFC